MRTAFISFALIFVAMQSVAGNGGSAYTAFGIGDVRYFPSTRSAGMGFTGIGLPSPNYINSMSPATWNRISRVRMEANAMYEGINTAETDKALYQARGLFNGAMIAMPISPANGIVFVGGFTPYSYRGYNTTATSSQGGIEYTINEIGKGGLTKAQVGLSYAPGENLSFGASMNYLFGTTTIERAFTPKTTGYSGGTLFIEEENRGINFTFGGLFNGFGNMAEGLRPLSIGFVVTTQANMTVDLINRINYTAEQDTFATSEKSMTIPVAFGVGAAWQVADRWLLAADYYSQAWSKGRFDGQPFLFIRNSSRFGVGAEKLPLRDANKWFDRLAYRFGFSYSPTYYQVFGESINQWSVTGGVTVPISGETRLNIGLEYGERGVKRANLVKDNILRVSFSLNIVEPWFVRYEEE